MHRFLSANGWRRWLAAWACVACAPLLMAPGPFGCDVCISEWAGSLEPDEIAPHPQEQVQGGLDCVARLEVREGTASLAVNGQIVSNLECGAEGPVRWCTFKAAGDGAVSLDVIAGNQGADYTLTFGYYDGQ